MIRDEDERFDYLKETGRIRYRTRGVTRGAPQLIDFTDRDGRVVKRWMVPLLDENGHVIEWVDARKGTK